MPVTPSAFSPATTSLLGGANDAIVGEDEETRRKRLQALLQQRQRIGGALGTNGGGLSGASPATAALLGNFGLGTR